MNPGTRFLVFPWMGICIMQLRPAGSKLMRHTHATVFLKLILFANDREMDSLASKFGFGPVALSSAGSIFLQVLPEPSRRGRAERGLGLKPTLPSIGGKPSPGIFWPDPGESVGLLFLPSDST